MKFAIPLFTAIAASACQKDKVDLDPKQKAERSVGNHASTTAFFWVDAVRSCEIIGVPNIHECAKNRGNLMDEKTASMFAEMAIKKREEYAVICAKDFPTDYCTDLLDRAIKIELRKPPESNPPTLDDTAS